METPQSAKKRALPPPRTRKSIAHMPAFAVNNEKENVTANLAVPSTSAQGNVTAKKPRSRSIGPGGLDTLKEDAGNRRQSAMTPFVKSILKPTLPISPVRRNSPRSKSRSLSPKKLTPEKKQNGLSMLGPPDGSAEPIALKSGPVSPSQYRTRIVVRSEEEQHAAAKERERHELLAHKEARRKSLANRRVSFAPEATLHTWDVVELPEDSTVSSASTNLTRRASALSAIAASPFPLPSPMPTLDASERPLTPPAQIEEIQVTDSPSHQRDLHQKKHRRSSVIPPMNFNDPNEFSSSPCSRTSANDDVDEEIKILKAAEEGDYNSISDDNDSTEGESTMTGIDSGELSAHSLEDSSTGSSFRLEEALRLAAKQAGTQGIEYDENGDISMELADDEITSAFQPWVKESKRISQVRASMALQEDENINPFSPAFKASATEVSVADEAENTMELTRSVGTILTDSNQRQSIPDEHLQLASASAKRSNGGGHRRSSGNSSVFGDETMDLTIAMGAIHQDQPALSSPQPVEDLGSGDEDEELSMDFTSAVGGLLERFRVPQNETSVQNENHSSGREFPIAENPDCSEGVLHAEETGILMTAGGSLSSITEQTEPPEDQTMEMDVTTAIGAILSQELSASKISKSKLLLETPRDDGHPNSSPFSKSLPSSARTSNHIAVITSETGSPSLTSAQRRKNMKKMPSQRQSTTPKSASRQSGSTMKISTPSKQHFNKMLSPVTPSKTPPSRATLRKTVSPRKTPKAEPQHSSPASQKIQAVRLFNKDPHSREATPTIVLKPPLRRSSGVGVDRPGLGSPRVTALLDRRQSIGKDAETFKLQKEGSKTVAFKDTHVTRDDLQKQDVPDEKSVSETAALKGDINIQSFGEEKDTTANLKDLIESLTPRKKKLNGRKSLHVGAAKGLLGKRPVELDEDDEDDSTPKRLKGREGSPVKKVRLPAPPSKNQTTGRVTRSARRSLEETAGNANIITPTRTGERSASKLRKDEGISDVENPLRGMKVMPDTIQDTVEPQYADEMKSTAARVHLQDFLNMTSIRFMELTTTKRRLTVAPNNTSENAADKLAGLEDTAIMGRRGSKLEQCVIAGACTIPMLELYQHSCRELKKYIAEGRSIVREIEADTYEENPPLFREYIEAPPETKSVMDNQFKNVKTHARLLSKAMWYEWRMKLLDSLKEGLAKISDEMDADGDSLVQQQKILAPTLPNLVHQHDRLEAENHVLQARADEFANDDQEALKDTRVELIQIEKEIEAERKVLGELQDEFRRQEARIEYAVDQRQNCLEQIEEAEKVRLEGRGWSPSEIASLQARVSDLEKNHNWTISSANGTSLTMTYRHTLQLYFTPASFMQNMAVAPTANNMVDSPISLTYIGDAQEYKSQPLSTEKRFFLQIMRADLQCLPQATTKIKDLLKFVSHNWEIACLISEEARILGISYITEATILLDEVMTIKAVLLLRDMKTKVYIGFEVKVQSDEKAIELDVNIQPTATVIYGEELKEKKMAEFLQQKIGGKNDKLASGNVGVWARAMLDLQERLIARGRK